VATRINPALARLWISSTTRQYGYRTSTRVRNLAEDQQRLLDYLEQGLTDAQMESLNQISRISPDRSVELLSRLAPVLWQSKQTLSSRDLEQRFAEMARVFLHGGDPGQILRERLRRKVFIEKLDSTGFTICKALDVAGIGKLISLDQKRIQPADLGALSFSVSQLGIPRVRAAPQLIGKRLEFHSRISKSLNEIATAVIIANHVINPASY
jgi:hypothetical protein